MFILDCPHPFLLRGSEFGENTLSPRSANMTNGFIARPCLIEYHIRSLRCHRGKADFEKVDSGGMRPMSGDITRRIDSLPCLTTPAILISWYLLVMSRLARRQPCMQHLASLTPLSRSSPGIIRAFRWIRRKRLPSTS